MRTLTGTIKVVTGVQVEVTLEIQGAPFSDSGAVVTAFAKRVSTSPTGFFQVDLPSANYRISWAYNGVSNVGYFTLPAGPGTTDLSAIIASNAAAPITPDITAATAAAAAAAVTTVSHPTTITSTGRWQYLVGTRSSPAAVTLPDPGGAGQRIDILDASGQATTYPISVVGGTRTIDPSGPTTFVMNLDRGTLSIVWTGSLWKIV